MKHASDCAIHNGPALPAEPCDCGAEGEMTQSQFDALHWLHIYAQPHWHAEAKVMGTRTALLGLRDAIDRALQTGMDARANGIVSDGEGYHVVVSIRSRDALKELPDPYTDIRPVAETHK